MRKQPRPRILTFVMLTTITLITWVAFEVLRAFTYPAPVQVDEHVLEEFTPKIDTTTLQNLKQKEFFPDSEARQASPTGSPGSNQ